MALKGLIKVVSFAYRIDLHGMLKEKSFTATSNKKGPKTEP